MLTNKQIEDLHAAISAAVNPGKCHYVLGGVVSCVIGQLYVIRGGNVNTLSRWGGLGIRECNGIAHLSATPTPIPEFVDLPGTLLADLQEEWDKKCDPTEELWERRAKLRDIVAEWVTT